MNFTILTPLHLKLQFAKYGSNRLSGFREKAENVKMFTTEERRTAYDERRRTKQIPIGHQSNLKQIDIFKNILNVSKELSLTFG